MQETIHGGWGHKRVGHSFVIKTTMVYNGASCVAQMVKNLPAMQETQVRSLDWEDPLRKRKATHLSILAWRIPWTEEPGGLQSIKSQKVRDN